MQKIKGNSELLICSKKTTRCTACFQAAARDMLSLQRQSKIKKQYLYCLLPNLPPQVLCYRSFAMFSHNFFPVFFFCAIFICYTHTADVTCHRFALDYLLVSRICRGRHHLPICFLTLRFHLPISFTFPFLCGVFFSFCYSFLFSLLFFLLLSQLITAFCLSCGANKYYLSTADARLLPLRAFFNQTLGKRFLRFSNFSKCY